MSDSLLKIFQENKITNIDNSEEQNKWSAFKPFTSVSCHRVNQEDSEDSDATNKHQHYLTTLQKVIPMPDDMIPHSSYNLSYFNECSSSGWFVNAPPTNVTYTYPPSYYMNTSTTPLQLDSSFKHLDKINQFENDLIYPALHFNKCVQQVPVSSHSLFCSPTIFPKVGSSKAKITASLNKNPCECPNCQEAVKVEGPNNHIKANLHNCHIPGCGKVYSKTSHLKAHLHWHSGERPFVCSWLLCGKKFTRSDELQRHVKEHSTNNEKERKHKIKIHEHQEKTKLSKSHTVSSSPLLTSSSSIIFKDQKAHSKINLEPSRTLSLTSLQHNNIVTLGTINFPNVSKKRRLNHNER